MAEIVDVRPADLLVDEENPRLSEPNAGQREAYRALARDPQQQRKLLRLAQHIVEHGLNPSKMPIVEPAKSAHGKYVVLEGNRRLAALKALETPESLVGSVSAGTLKEIRQLSKRYHEAPVDEVPCVVVKNRAEAHTWIELEHTGENQGAGMVPWDAVERGRFRARSGDLPPHLQALDFLERRGDLDADRRRGVASTSLQRLLSTPAVRERLGLELRDKKLYRVADEDRVAKALKYVVEHLPSVGEIYTAEQRVKFAENLPPSVRVKASIEPADSIELGSKGSGKKKSQSSSGGSTKRSSDRTTLIPKICNLNVTDERVRAIEGELRRLHVVHFKNAVSVLMRVFIELSTDCYIERVGLIGVNENDVLAKKMQFASQDLQARKKLSKQQASPVNRAISSDAFLAPSVKLMHQYVHNPYIFPAPGDLIAHWDSFQPFITALWTD